MISPHFPPDGSAASHRVRLLAPHLAAYGWEPTVLTLETAAYEGSLDPRLGSFVPSSIRVVRCPAWRADRTRRAGFGDLGLRALTGLRRGAIAELRQASYQALFITVYPVYPSLLGPMLKRRFHVPFVLDYQDPWVGSWGQTVGGGRNGTVDWKSRASRVLGTCLEPYVVRSADAITAVSRGTYEDILSRISVARKPIVAPIPLGWEAADYAAVNGGPTGWFDPNDGLVHLSYVGTVLPNGMATLRTLLAAVARLRTEDRTSYARLRLHFFGTSNQFGGEAPTRVLPIAQMLGVGDVVSEHPARIPYVDALRVLKQSTGILLLGSSEPHYTASKIYPALLSGRPILALFHQGSSSTTILRQVTRPPSVRLLAYSSMPDADDLFPLLLDLVRHPAFDPADVNLTSAAPFSARALAGTLAHVFDQVCVQSQPVSSQLS